MEHLGIKEQVILVDTDYADTIAAGFSSHFSRQMGRALPPADLADWLVCCALDSGMKQGGEVQVLLVHSKGKDGMESFLPKAFAEMDGMAFRDDRMGEFLLSCIKDDSLEGDVPFMMECLQTLLSDKALKRLAVVSDDATCYKSLCDVSYDPQRHVVFQLSMEPSSTQSVESLSMGYSLLHAMGVSADEI